ncbi:MAG: hypothetical protein JRC77_05520 [Deltaproteobacteria bacterium]|nr:hypothetical protein [Deltaproteobacteria bacterium]
MAIPLGGGLAFLITYTTLSIATMMITRAERARVEEDEGRSSVDRFTGGIFGAVRGLLLLLLIGLFGHYLAQGQRAGVVHSLPPIENSFMADMSGDLLEVGISMALDQACVASKMAASLAVRPADTKDDLAEIMAFDSVRGVIADPSFWILVQAGEVDGAIRQLSFQRMVYDASLREALGEHGFLQPESVEDPVLFRESLRPCVSRLCVVMGQIQDNPAIEKLIDSDEVMDLVRSGDTVALIRHPLFIESVASVLAGFRTQLAEYGESEVWIDEEAPRTGHASGVEQELASAPDDPDAIVTYRYRDQKGRKRYAKDLNHVPEEFRDQAEKVTLSSGN